MIKETPVFFKSDGLNIFGVVHDSSTVTHNKAMVFCHSFAEEKLWSHRVLVSYARLLAKMGYLCIRFDYRGYGDSQGEFSDCTIESYADDIKNAVIYIKTTFPKIQEIGLIGHRLGASIVLDRYDYISANGPIILWDPIIDGNRYIQEFLRSHLTTQLAVYGEIRETREKLIESMESGKLVNVEGYDLNYSQYDSISKIMLNKQHYDSGASILIVQINRNLKIKKDVEDLAYRANSELKCVVEDPFWREIKKFYYEAPELYKATTDWLKELQ
ncbi:MAG: alpha/beta hydrolase [Gammaproteobacteria bacterium]|nr:alpha/beta hydrolase [Gammaproteobacteria bacterium]